MDDGSRTGEHALHYHLRSARAVLEQLSAASDAAPFRYLMLDIMLQLADELTAGGVSLNLVEMLDDMLHAVLDDIDSDAVDSSDEVQWVDAA